MAKWAIKNRQKNFEKMSQDLGISEIFANVLINNSINSRYKFYDYVNGDIDSFNSLRDMKDVYKAYDIIKNSVSGEEKICIYGDYDVDGIISTTILYKGIEALNGKVSFYIPHRKKEGYGLNMETCKKLVQERFDLIITCDNGISAIEEINFLMNNGLKVIVLDHHEPKIDLENNSDILPVCDACVDPKQKDCNYPFKGMCAGFLSYRFVKEMYLYFNKKLKNEDELICLSAIATVCDIMELQGENRIIVKKGLEILNSKSVNKGLDKLIKLKDIKEITEYTLGFIIGPSLNAPGRLATSDISVRLLLSRDEKEIDELAQEITRLNDERKRITQEGIEWAEEEINKIYDDKVYILYSDKISESVAGIIAGRIKERFNKPTIILTDSENCVKGSGRSVEKYDMFGELSKIRELFTKFGGHKMAVGLSMEKSDIPLLREKLNKNCTLNEEDFESVYYVDRIINLSEITMNIAEELETMKPFGKGNEKPVFASLKVKVKDIKYIGRNKEFISITFAEKGLKGILFNNCEKFKNNVENKGLLDFRVDILYNIEINEFNGYKNLQLKIVDFRFKEE